MSHEEFDDEFASTFRNAYQRAVEASPSGESWPPLQSLGTHPPLVGGTSGWIRAVAAFAVVAVVAFGTGWLTRSNPTTEPDASFYLDTPPTTRAAVLMDPAATFDNPFDAVIDAADGLFSTLPSPSATARMVVIFADSGLVDLRMQVKTEDACQWYGVTGRVTEEGLRWSSGPGLSCDD